MKNLYKSLAKFQKELKGIPKDSSGYGYKYCKLETLIKIVTPILNKNGLVLIQSIDTDEQSRLPSVKTTLAHIDSGEAIESWTPVSEVKLGSMNLYQSVGAGITYYRRYALAGMLGIAPDEDIDANDDPAPASVSSTSKPIMSDANYKSILMSAKAKHKEKKTWKQIQTLISENFVIDMKYMNKLEKELYG
tara:strand:+ start:858 stop:1430 length:573 start_codon:yes stop_codon:yes gene_type:complete